MQASNSVKRIKQSNLLTAHQLIAVILLIVWLALTDFRPVAGLRRSKWLDGAAFKVSARVRVIRENSVKVDEEMRVTEYYSNSKRRSRLAISPIGWSKQQTDSESTGNSQSAATTTINYYFNGASEGRSQLLKTKTYANRVEDNCKLASVDELATDLFGAMSSVDRHLTGDEWLKERGDEAPNYLIGFARLLLIVDANRDKLDQPPGPSAKIRNQEAVRFLLRDPLEGGAGGEGWLTVYYGNSSLTRSLPDDMPLRIWFRLRGGAEIVADYSQVAYLEQEAGSDYSEGTGDVDSADSLLAFPLDSSCASQLPQVDLLGGRPAPRMLSFRARVEDMAGELPPLSYFVAYDSLAGALRRETIFADPVAAGRSHHSLTIHDLRRGRKYNVRQEVASASGSDVPWTAAPVDFTGSSQCIARRSRGQLTQLEPAFHLSAQLAAMGQAKVRGVNSLVFERVADQLPALVFPRASYTDSNGVSRSGYLPAQNKLRPRFSLNYYFAQGPNSTETGSGQSSGESLRFEGHPLGPLLRIDVLRDRYLVYRVEIEDFRWLLVDAPNGDPASELFALRDRCVGDDLRAENFANLAMELEFNAADTKQQKMEEVAADIEAPITSISTVEAMNSLQSPRLRSLALARALSQSSGNALSLVQIHRVESRLVEIPTSSFRLEASARLNYPRQQLYQAISVGRGRTISAGSARKATTFDECFWEAAHRRKATGNQLLFSFCFDICRLDDEPAWENGIDGQPEIRGSSVFTIAFDDELPCEIFKLQIEDQDEELASRYFWSKLKRDLMKVGELKLSVATVEGQPRELSFQLKRLELNNERWSDDFEDPNDLSPSDLKRKTAASILDGLGLPLDRSTRVESRKPRPEVSSQDEQPTMNYQLCHSSCLASMSCRSFSICASGQRLECLISELDFRNNKELLRMIAQQAAPLKDKDSRGSIRVEMPAASSKLMAVDANYTEQVELRVDRRCHIYSKRSLELYAPAEPIHLSLLSNKSIVGADSEEQCAEMCMRANVLFFRQQSNKQIELQTSNETQVAEIREKQLANLRSWCESFAFYDLFSSPLPENLKSQLDPSKLNKQGLCFRARPAAGGGSKKQTGSGKRKEDKARSSEPRIKLHKYQFLYANLFEPQRGQKLLSLNMESAASDRQVSSGEMSNHQSMIGVEDVESCARACFTQSSGPEPWCRSFAIVREKLPAPPTIFGSLSPSRGPSGFLRCILNSMSMTEALKSPQSDKLIAQVPNEQLYEHYEPRNLLATETLIYLKRTNKEGGSSRIKGRPAIAYLKIPAIWLLLALSLVTGFFVTKFVDDRLIQMTPEGSWRRESVEHPSRSFLNSLIMGDNEMTHRRFEQDMDLPDILVANADTL